MSVAQAKEAPILQPARMHLAEHARHDWVVDVEEGRSIEQILDPGFWAHCADQFQVFDNIEARAEDGAWIAELTVLQCSKNWAKVYLKQKYVLSSTIVQDAASGTHEVKWKGPHLMWCAIRLSDGEVIQKSMPSKDAATLWLNEYEKGI